MMSRKRQGNKKKVLNIAITNNKKIAHRNQEHSQSLSGITKALLCKFFSGGLMLAVNPNPNGTSSTKAFHKKSRPIASHLHF